jgi:hypothetical protein
MKRFLFSILYYCRLAFAKFQIICTQIVDNDEQDNPVHEHSAFFDFTEVYT